MGLGKTRMTTSNFCRGGCPLGTRPYYHYWITAAAPIQPHYILKNKLYRFSQEVGDNCEWAPVKYEIPFPRVEAFYKTKLPFLNGTTGYALALQLFDGTISNLWTKEFRFPIPETIEVVNPEAPSSCSRIHIVLPHQTFGMLWPAVIRAGYPNCCDDSDFPRKVQTKFVAPY